MRDEIMGEERTKVLEKFGGKLENNVIIRFNREVSIDEAVRTTREMGIRILGIKIFKGQVEISLSIERK
jgi:hypothetical protein